MVALGAVLSYPFSLNAQVQFNLNGGISIPVGAYGSTSTEEIAYFAETGGFAKLAIDIEISQDFFLHVNGAISQNAFDHNTYANILKNAGGINTLWVLEETFTPLYFTVGPGVRFEPKGWSIDLRPKIGFAYIDFNNISMRTPTALGLDINYSDATSLAYGGTVSFTRFLGDHFGIGLQAGFLTAEMERNYSTSLRDEGVPPYVEFGTDDFNPSVLTFGLGVSYRL